LLWLWHSFFFFGVTAATKSAFTVVADEQVKDMTTASANLMTKLEELVDAQVSFAFDLLLFFTSRHIFKNRRACCSSSS
jgi:hypothetical protein